MRRLVCAQLIRVPFENISKLFLRKTRGAVFAPSLEEHLDGIERHHFGGTCYANNPHFFSLLRHLGYQTRLCAADMSIPDAHIVSMVELEGREYLVDVGYAAPFFEPLPRDLEKPHEVRFGTSRYVLEPQDADGRSRLRLIRSGREIHGYVAKPETREISDFADGIRDSYRSTATFMNTLVVERFSPGGSLRIHNLTRTESTPESSRTTQIADREELATVVEQTCGIAAGIVRQAIDGVDLEGDIYT
ncbi:MAG: arylamine N-acetyltransferase [Acidobacteriota bacterium]